MSVGRAAGLAALAVYGASMAGAGLIAALGLGASVPAAAQADAVQARPVATAPVITPLHSLGSGGPAPAASAPDAAQGADLAAGSAVFTPRRIVLPDGTPAPVVPVGVHSDGALAIPDDVHTVGWWTGGSKAGEPFGSVVIAGHVDSAIRGIGVFAELKHLQPGQLVRLEAARTSLRYRITSATQVPQARIAQDAGFFRVDGEPQLVLITCGGAFDPVRHRYQDNLVVLATPIS